MAITLLDQPRYAEMEQSNELLELVDAIANDPNRRIEVLHKLLGEAV